MPLVSKKSAFSKLSITGVFILLTSWTKQGTVVYFLLNRVENRQEEIEIVLMFLNISQRGLERTFCMVPV